MAEASKERGLRFVIAYKTVRAGGALFLSLLFAILTGFGLGAPLRDLAERVRHHATTAWSMQLADLFVSAATPRHLWILVAGLAMDGAFSAFEAWSLHKRWWWGPWLVVVATAAFLPFEIGALVRHPTGGRLVLLIGNLAIAAYLAQAALRKHRVT
jgi:uncharacterized membrane protein (DUF2068 family)